MKSNVDDYMYEKTFSVLTSRMQKCIFCTGGNEIYRVIHADGILKVSRERLNIFCWNLECSLGWVQTLYLKYFELCGVADQSERTPNFDFQMEHPVSNLIFEFLARRLVININTSYFIKIVNLSAKQ